VPTPTLLTKELERTLPPIKSCDNVARVKYFTPWTNWTWYAAEASRREGPGEQPQEDHALKDVGLALAEGVQLGDY